MKTCKGCKHYKKDERTRLIVCEYGLSKINYCEKDKEDFAIEELEKLKTEIGRIETEEGGDFLERPAIDIIYEAQKIIDNHISELKGE